jgi:hypothetical protein
MTRIHHATQPEHIRRLLAQTFISKPVAERKLHNSRIRAVKIPGGYTFAFKKLDPETRDVLLHAISLSDGALEAMVSMVGELKQ